MNLVFASGFLVPQDFFGKQYFNGLEKRIKDEGKHEAIFPYVGPLDSCAKRAPKLAKAIAENFPTGEVHIIAHSMGGLDSRFMIAGNLEGLSTPGRIKSLTTIATPHLGSPVADLLLNGNVPEKWRAAAAVIVNLIRLSGVETGALVDLTEDGVAKIPDPRQTHSHIRYRSYCTVGRPAVSGFLGLGSFLGFPPKKTSGALVPTHEYIKSVTGEDNDGLVALKSAQYGDVQQPFWQCDHADAVGYNLDQPLILPPPAFDHLAAYEAIIRQLEKDPP
jgi:triacylglycerol lipase